MCWLNRGYFFLNKIGVIVLFIVLLHSTPIAAQFYEQAPDYEAITNITSDTSSYYYYPKLFAKYQNGDTTLGLKAYRMLYYGSLTREKSTTKTYEEFMNDRYEMYVLLSKKKYKGKKLEKIIELTKENLQTNPFSILSLVILNVMYENKGDTAKAKQYLNMATGVRDAIMSTGDGESEKTAYHIVNIEHEYDVIWLLDYEYADKRTLTKNNCDYMEVKKNVDKVEGIYFDISNIYKN